MDEEGFYRFNVLHITSYRKNTQKSNYNIIIKTLSTIVVDYLQSYYR